MIRRAAPIVVLAAGLGLGWQSLPGRTPTINGPDPIAVLEPVEIGGMTQWLLIRWPDRSAPVLLWLHGAPRAAQMPLAQAKIRMLERGFVVVHWDQRGAGKPNPFDFDPANMSLEHSALLAMLQMLVLFLTGAALLAGALRPQAAG